VVDPALAAKFKDVPVACVSDAMSRLTAGGSTLRPMHAGGAMAGAALTVRTRPGDNLMIHKALKLIQPGDVLVVDAGGDLTNALVGELMLSHAMMSGAAGVIINGAVRDCGWIRANRFPVFAAGVTHRGPHKDGPGEVNAPVAFGGMVVEPGALVIGDDDGLLCLPYGEEEALLAQACEKRDKEAAILARTLAGDLDPKTWVDEALRRLGCGGI
jgi:regulator of RNase E activity RraA